MKSLFDIGIMEDEIQELLYECPNLKNISDQEVNEKIVLLQYIGCKDIHIRNIIISNPYYLECSIEKVSKLLNGMLQLGFKTLYLLLDENPRILNLDLIDIHQYINNQIKQGILLMDIIYNLEDNPLLFDNILDY